jgi:lysozyme
MRTARISVISLVTMACTSAVVVACGSSSAPPNFGCATQAVTADSVCASGQTVKGADVSHYQGTLNWGTIKSGGIDFAFAKATEGTSFVDPDFSANWTGMKSAGVIRGAYHFYDAGVDPTQQAMHFLSELQAVGGIQAGDLPPVIDFEVSDTNANVCTMASALQAGTGLKPIIYTSSNYAGSFTTDCSATLWVANWGVSCPSLPSAWTGWMFWQTADTEPNSGGDADEFNGSLAQLQSFTGASGSGSSSGSSSGSGSGSSSGSSSSGSGSGSSSGSSSSGSGGGSSSGSSGSSSSSSGAGSGSGSSSGGGSSGGAPDGGDGTMHAGGSSGGGDAGTSGNPCGS